VFWKKRVVGRGFLMVKPWWIDGETWWENCLIAELKTRQIFQLYFLGSSEAGEGQQRIPFGDDNKNCNCKSNYDYNCNCD
jgi:hypothetical protein